jgi:hypothetical protein
MRRFFPSRFFLSVLVVLVIRREAIGFASSAVLPCALLLSSLAWLGACWGPSSSGAAIYPPVSSWYP